jgi:dihydropteroate synthase
MIWRARQFTFEFPRPVLLMGVVNVTPDSFSDGGRFLDPARAAEHALELIAEGADIIDIGGESTRPGAAPVDEAEERRRVLPVLQRLAGRVAVPLSIDTMKPGVARAAVEAGASIVNDVAGGGADGAMWRVAAATGAGYVLMHMQGAPSTMQVKPEYADVAREVRAFFDERLERLAAAGVAREQVALDPGLGFGKTVEHNLRLLGALRSFTTCHRPLLLGASRKSFLGRIAGGPAETGPAARAPGSLACACWAVTQGVAILRTHDVAATRQAARVTEAIGGRAAASGPAANPA